MTHKMIFGECDACATKNRVLHLCEAYGIETAACALCRNGDLSDDLDDLEAEIESLCLFGAGEADVARICALELALAEARAAFAETHGQFGVGA
jgi:hypothetical protein